MQKTAATRTVRRVAVLGSGVMGSAIAAHFANAGIPSLVLDIVPAEPNELEKAAGLGLSDRAVRDRIAVSSVQALAKTKPAPLFAPWRLDLIETGNLEDDLPRLSEADWVIEVVREEMKIKKTVLANAADHINDRAILSSNTSGLSLGEMAAALPESLRSRFLGTHFFNPPRYMRLLEIIPTGDTAPEVVETVSELCRDRLGKGIVTARDTPNFIANRIGVHSMMSAVKVMQEEGLTVEEVDALTGPAMGRPRTATFKLADLVGLDTLLLVARTVHGLAEYDESREIFNPPEFLVGMVEQGLLGRKAGAGFYKMVREKGRKTILTLDLEKLEYREKLAPELPELAALRAVEGTSARVSALVAGDGRGSRAAWKILAATLSYAAMRMEEIAADAVSIDRAIELGFNWKLGPFATWDALGFRESTERIRAGGWPLPAWIDQLYESGATSLFEERDGVLHGPAAVPSGRAPVPVDPRATDFDRLRRRGAELLRNDSASLIDLGDGVLGLEFHSKMNAIDLETIEMVERAVERVEADRSALVVANNGVNFCAGANLGLLAGAARQGDFGAIEKIVRAFQRATNLLEQCSRPVVIAPHGMALGGGCEFVVAGNAIQAAAESYIGLVEVGAGLIPAGGGCLRLYKRQIAGLADPTDLYPALRRTFETIGMAKVSTSAEEARQMGFLREQDGWSMNRDQLIADAASVARGLAGGGYAPPVAERAIPVMGRGGMAVIEAGLVNMLEGRFISEHDRKIGGELARIISGGDIAGPTTVSEQHILDLECEAFLRLCGEPKTHERVAALLKTGKPLRN